MVGAEDRTRTKLHWDRIYAVKRPDELSWYRLHLDTSLELIVAAAPERSAAIIDVGGGEATLVDDLLARGYTDLSVLDISQNALDAARSRLGARARDVKWICADVTAHRFARRAYDVWHDRAVFHFLTAASDRDAYVRQVAAAVKPGGHVIVATFGPEGPLRCSGLDTMRYGAAELHAEFGDAFRLVEHRTELHHTPSGALQQFLYCYCRRVDNATA